MNLKHLAEDDDAQQRNRQRKKVDQVGFVAQPEPSDQSRPDDASVDQGEAIADRKHFETRENLKEK